MLCQRSNPALLLLLPSLGLIVSLFLLFTSPTQASAQTLTFPEVVGVGAGAGVDVGAIGGNGLGVALLDTTGEARRHSGEENSSSLILVAERTRRRDPLDNFKRYTGGYNISNEHYWASVGLTAAPFFVIAGVWFVLFGLCLSFICLCYCCCQREHYGYSRACYAISLIFLIVFTVAAIAGCVVLYTGQGKFHSITTKTLDYVVSQANVTTENLRNVSDYLAVSKSTGVNSVFLPTNVQNNIDKVETKINSSANALSTRTQENSKDIQDGLDSMRLALIIVAAVMLALAFLGFLFSILGLQCLVYFLVILGWILVAGTFILCGAFLLIHNVLADSCVAMDEWALNPTAKTAMDDIIPCVDNATAQATLNQTKEVTYQLVNVVDNFISNVSNRNIPAVAAAAGVPVKIYYNQSGPLVPLLCNPFDADYSTRQCATGEVDFSNATQVWKNYICQVSSAGICTTPGRLTPTLYDQMASAVNITYGLYHYGPFLIGLEDCSFVRQAFMVISSSYCPGFRRYTECIYIGLVIVSAAVMLSLIFWVIYARERRHRVYTKQFNSRALEGIDKAS